VAAVRPADRDADADPAELEVAYADLRPHLDLLPA
jgi:uncharacterized protein YbjT (DUF2867 family)